MEAGPLLAREAEADSEETLSEFLTVLRELDEALDASLLEQEGSAQGEPLTLPVLLFLEHHINMRPNSAPTPTTAPLRLQSAGEAGDSNGGGAVVGRGALTAGAGGAARRSGHDVAPPASPDCLQVTVHLTEETESVPTEESDAGEEEQKEESWSPLGAALACFSCTVGLLNLSRFAIFSVHFGGNFIVQFMMLSLAAGVPLLLLYISLGRVLRCGSLAMWRISPLLRGVGVALLVTHALLGFYTVVGVAWLLVYFRDSFITADDRYRWTLISLDGWTGNVSVVDSVPHYWQEEVLLRSPRPPRPGSLGNIKFQTAFNLAVVWMIVFVALSKGLRSYGKAVYVVTLAPVCGALALCTKLLTLTPADAGIHLFAQTEWGEFFTNTNSWSAAAQEAFLTWGLLGACAMHVMAQTGSGQGRGALCRAAACAVFGALTLLMLAALLANACVSVLRHRGLLYLPSATMPEGGVPGYFVWRADSAPAELAATPVRFIPHFGSALGVTLWPVVGSGAAGAGSWQPLQLLTELVPAALATIDTREVSPAWTVLLYGVVILLGVGQQLVLWHGVVGGLVEMSPSALRPWATSVTFCTCLAGLCAGLLLATDGGLVVARWLDFVVGGGWWVVALHTLLVVGVLVVRGRPYSAEAVAAAMFPRHPRCAAALAALWTLVLPPLMLALSVVEFRAGRQRQLYWWRRAEAMGAGSGWTAAARRGGAALQQAALLTVPLAAAVQTYRYLRKGPPDILDRIQNLYRPHMNGEESIRARSGGGAGGEGAGGAAAAPAPVEAAQDPPPKYTPPPSYSTATGARILNTLRRSIRAVRRLRSRPATVEVREPSPPRAPTVSESLELGARARAARNALSVGGRRGGGGGGSARTQRLRRSLRESFKFNSRSNSREQLTNRVEPVSNTPPVSPSHASTDHVFTQPTSR